MKNIYTDVNNNTHVKDWTPGPPSLGLVSVHAEIPPYYLAAMKANNIGGMLPVNEQIRRAIRAYVMGGLVYISPVKR